MQVGLAAIFQNPEDHVTDGEVYRNELRMADLAEPLGFDSVWGVEHHFTDYTMCPDVLQFLTYMAGRTKKIKLGSMVVVLPWHDPIRVAEQISMLDHISEGRFILGMGRGAGRVEFEGFRVPMGESRERFVEAAQLVLTGLEKGYCEYEGKYYQQPKKDIRPRPERTFKGRTYAAAVSPESVEIMARLGIGILVIPQKPWPMVDAELAAYRDVYQKVNNAPAPAPIIAGWCFCDEDEKRAREMAVRWIGGYWETARKHYEFGGEHFAKTKGYEFYAAMSQAQRASANQMTEMYLDLQVWGTPKMCIDRIRQTCEKTGSNAFTTVFSYAGMPWNEAERNLRLFAAKVLPVLQKDEATAVAAGG
jgi:alkanesulfonate monooxygenase SsuD/methylene tetrahydromethanopterin reductase-like flavin-dependent oxidoreductase (luciferase family)